MNTNQIRIGKSNVDFFTGVITAGGGGGGHENGETLALALEGGHPSLSTEAHTGNNQPPV